jgi:hypothetical protein
MNELFTKLKRLFEPRPRPAESVGEATADRPPPRAAEAPPAEPSPAEPPPAAPLRAESPPIEAVPPREPASLHEDDLAEVRAALEAVAEAPVEIAEPEAEAPVSAAEPDGEAPVSADDPEAEAPVALESEPDALFPPPTLLPRATEETVDVPVPVGGRVGDALLLTLGTPRTTFTVPKTSATLGRGQENTIRLDDLSVSRRHARIAYRQGGYWISDLGSMGGTWVDGTRLNAPRRIAFGEVIDIGLCRLTVSFTGTAAKTETRKTVTKPQETTAQVRRRR